MLQIFPQIWDLTTYCKHSPALECSCKYLHRQVATYVTCGSNIMIQPGKDKECVCWFHGASEQKCTTKNVLIAGSEASKYTVHVKERERLSLKGVYACMNVCLAIMYILYISKSKELEGPLCSNCPMFREFYDTCVNSCVVICNYCIPIG